MISLVALSMSLGNAACRVGHASHAYALNVSDTGHAQPVQYLGATWWVPENHVCEHVGDDKNFPDSFVVYMVALEGVPTMFIVMWDNQTLAEQVAATGEADKLMPGGWWAPRDVTCYTEAYQFGGTCSHAKLKWFNTQYGYLSDDDPVR